MRLAHLVCAASVLFLGTVVAAVSGPTSGNVMNYGAVGDGVTNDTAAFTRLLSN